MKTEEYFSELLFKYFAGQLSKEEELVLLDWLKESDERKVLISKMSDWWAVGHIPLYRTQMEEDFKKNFIGLTNSSRKAKTLGSILKLPKWQTVAAAIFLFITIGVTAFLIGRQLSTDREPAYFETYTPYGSQTNVELPDGSHVMLNAGSTLKYRTDFNDTDRRVELNGEAFFEVAKDEKKPFFVCSEKLNLRVEGTSFNVKAYKDDDIIDVVLVSGKVKVQFTSEEKEDILLVPNEQLSYNKTQFKTTLSVVNSSNSIAWTNGGLYFLEKSFQDIAKELERKYDVKIEIQSNVLNDEIFTGSFASDHKLEEIIQEMDMDKKYRWFYKEDKLIIADK